MAHSMNDEIHYPKYMSVLIKNNITIFLLQSFQQNIRSNFMEQNQPPLLQRLQSNDSSNYSSSIQDNQLVSMLATLSKLKHIFKAGQLTPLKHAQPKVNKVFKRMSSFFLPRKKGQKKKGLTKQQRIKIRMKRMQTEINKNSRKTFSVNSFQHSIQQQSVDMPEITQRIQHNHPKPESMYYLKCHICRISYNEEQIHPFYGSLCPTCANLNLIKRQQRADFSGLTALVTGGRIKIGFEIGVKLLRQGARVIITSRFPSDTLARYEALKDSSRWKDRLKIIQCDFLSQQQVQTLIDYVQAHVPKLDILINNAAQTIVRPKQFFHKQIKYEQLAIEHTSNQQTSIVRSYQQNPYPSVFSNSIVVKQQEMQLDKCDQFGQPIDKRKINTWVQPIQNVSLLDCYTTQVVNSIVPFHIISKLKHKMVGTTPSWIINVSSMEGVFHRSYKSQHHPHTNMAKAALNMITRTCSKQFKQEGIFMNSVDTGWVTNENPLPLVDHMSDKYGFKCPLDCVDGAMRVLDPIYQGVVQGQFPSGHFLKNYRVHPW